MQGVAEAVAAAAMGAVEDGRTAVAVEGEAVAVAVAVAVGVAVGSKAVVGRRGQAQRNEVATCRKQVRAMRSEATKGSQADYLSGKMVCRRGMAEQDLRTDFW